MALIFLYPILYGILARELVVVDIAVAVVVAVVVAAAMLVVKARPGP